MFQGGDGLKEWGKMALHAGTGILRFGKRGMDAPGRKSDDIS